MRLSVPELLTKFPFLRKFEDQTWIADNSINQKISDKEIPLICCLEVIKETIRFIESTKFNSHWESCFSVKTRLQQLESLLLYFTEDSVSERSKKKNT